MATNRFDKPVESEYISQYTPIPFEQLYAIGKANNERVDKAYRDLGDKFTKWAEFRSPSAVDTKRWYDLTIGQGQHIVNELAANPDLIKTAEGRARIQSFINSRPYYELSNLQQSRDNMLKRQEMNQKLALAGRFNSLWHDVDFANYDTRDGIFSDISPLAYKSERELVEPYLNNLESSFIESDGMYDYFGISPERVRRQLQYSMSDIYNTPEAQMHVQSYIKQGFTPEQAQKMFITRVYNAGHEFETRNRKENAFAQISARHSNSNSGSNNTPSSLFYLTDSLELTGLKKFDIARNAYLSSNTNYKDLLEQSQSSDPDVKKAADERLNKLYENATPQNMFRTILGNRATTNGFGLATNDDQIGDQMQYAVNEIQNIFGYRIANSRLNNLLSSTIQGITNDEQTTPLGKRKVISGGENLSLMSNTVLSVAGLEHNNKSRNRVENALKAGKFNNMILLSNDNMITLPTASGSKNIQRLKVAVSEQDILNAGLTVSDMRKAGAERLETGANRTESLTDNLRGKTSGEISEIGKKIAKNWNKSKTVTTTPGTTYFVLDLSNSVPTSHDDINTEYLNQQALQMNVNPTTSSGLYPDVQNEAYGF